jgi:hypothetical protein
VVRQVLLLSLNGRVWYRDFWPVPVEARNTFLSSRNIVHCGPERFFIQ